MLINWEKKKDNENVVHVHNRILFSGKDSEIMKFSGKCIELDNILTVVGLRDTLYVLSHMWIIAFNVYRNVYRWGICHGAGSITMREEGRHGESREKLRK